MDFGTTELGLQIAESTDAEENSEIRNPKSKMGRWMELLIEADIVESVKLESLMNEADEILAMTVASINTAKRKSQKK